MKLKVVEFEKKEIETKYDLPVYLYFQDENCHDELIMITEKEKVTIKHDFFGYHIEVTNCFNVECGNLDKRITTKDHFESVLNEALNSLNSFKK